eukprot:6204824-Pleurochrysis_carterae.AAC.1
MSNRLQKTFTRLWLPRFTRSGPPIRGVLIVQQCKPACRLRLLQRQLHMVSAEETGPLSDFIVKTWGNSRVDNVAR